MDDAWNARYNTEGVRKTTTLNENLQPFAREKKMCQLIFFLQELLNSLYMKVQAFFRGFHVVYE